MYIKFLGGCCNMSSLENREKFEDFKTENRGVLDEKEEEKEKETPEGFGYVKLKGFEFSCVVQSCNFVIGRGKIRTTAQGFVGIGKCKKISRNHARIFWNKFFRAFQIQNIGKNSILVNRKQIQALEMASIPSGTPIKIGSVCFYFLLPS